MRAVIQNAGFRKLWIAGVVLGLGDAVFQMGLLEFFHAKGYTVRVETAKLFLAVSLPGFVFGPLVIAYLDRWQRRHVLMLGDALRALVVVLIAVWLLPVLTGRLEARGLLFVYSLVFVIGVVTTFYFPARYALIPNLVPSDDLITANTLFTVSLAAAQVGGRAVGGFVAEQCGVQWALLGNALAYVASVGLVWGIQMQPHATTGGPRAAEADGGPGRRGGLADLRDGLWYLWRHPTAIPLVAVTGAFAFLLGVFIVEIVGYAMETLHLGTGGLGYLIAPAGLGAGVGIVVMARGKAWTRAAWLPFVQLMIVGVLLVALSGTTNVWLAGGLLTLLGCVGATVMIPIDAALQDEVEDQRRGAVFAARGMLTSATMMVAFALPIWSPLFRRTPAPTILMWLGIGAAVAAALTYAALRSRRKRTR